MPDAYGRPDRRARAERRAADASDEADGAADSPDAGAGADATLTGVLDALDDADCRAMLAALDDPKTAGDLREECGVPSSTAYRKLDRLSDAGLVTERVSLREGFQQVTLYVRAFESVRFSADADGFSVEVEARERTPAERFAEAWARAGREL